MLQNLRWQGALKATTTATATSTRTSKKPRSWPVSDYTVHENQIEPWACFSKVPATFRARKAVVFVMFAYKIKVSTRRNRSVHLGVVVSRVCEDFLCQAGVSAAMLLIAKGWLKWVKKETWSHQIEDVASVNWLTQQRTRTTTTKCYGLVATSSVRVQENARVSSHFLSPHLASDSLSTAAPFPQPLLRSFLRGGGGCTQAMLPRLLSPHISRYPLNGELVRRLLHFSLL